MANIVIIDPNLAQRDINRIDIAKANLESAAESYHSLINEISSTYKGPAAEQLIEVIRLRIKSTKYGTEKMINELNSSRAIINKAIKIFKAYDDNMLNLIK